MTYLNKKQANGENWKRRTLFIYRKGCTIVRFSVTVAIMPTMIVVCGNVTTIDGINIPIIEAEETAWKQLPENPGGRVTDKTNYAINTLLIGNKAADPAKHITLAEAANEISQIDKSLRQFAVLSRNPNIQWLTSNDSGQYDSLITRMRMDNRYSNRLGKQITSQELKPGSVLAQVGAFGTEEEAVNEWRRLELTFKRVLQSRDWVIQQASTGNGDLYRLRIAGFFNWEEATDFCDRLAVRVSDCSPVMIN